MSPTVDSALGPLQYGSRPIRCEAFRLPSSCRSTKPNTKSIFTDCISYSQDSSRCQDQSDWAALNKQTMLIQCLEKPQAHND